MNISPKMLVAFVFEFKNFWQSKRDLILSDKALNIYFVAFWFCSTFGTDSRCNGSSLLLALQWQSQAGSITIITKFCNLFSNNCSKLAQKFETKICKQDFGEIKRKKAVETSVNRFHKRTIGGK